MRKGQTSIGSKLRNTLTNSFLADLKKVYDEMGIGAIKTMRIEDPTKFVIMVANLLPKEISMDITENKLGDMTDDEIAAALEKLGRGNLRPRSEEVDRGVGDGETPSVH